MHSFGLEDHFAGKMFAKGLKGGKNEDEKGFNRYVRQLVDQYLDKEVVISKQPEDKVEMIVQTCRDKFPEFAHWTTTRIRIYIESCRRLKKIKNSPLLLAKRKAAGRRFREGQKLKKILSSQYSVQAAEANRQLAEYLIRNGNVVKHKPMENLQSSNPLEDHLKAMIKTEVKNERVRPNYLNQAKQLQYEGLQAARQTRPFNPVLSGLMHLAPVSAASPDQQPPSMLERRTVTPPVTPLAQFPVTSLSSLAQFPVTSLCSLAQFPVTPMSSLGQLPVTSLSPMTSISPLTQLPLKSLSPLTLLHTMAPSSTRVLSPQVVSPRTPTASPPTMMSNTAFSQPVTSSTPTSQMGEVVNIAASITNNENSVSEALGKVINAMLQSETLKQAGVTPPPLPMDTLSSPLPREPSPVSHLSPKQKNFQIESLMNSSCSPILLESSTSASPEPDRQAHPMDLSDIQNAKTLVTSYREAANFLYRAASELEQLLPNNQRVF